MIDYPEFDPEYEYLDPAELGWVELRPHVWRLPNGDEFTFPSGGDRRDVIVRLKLPHDKKRQH